MKSRCSLLFLILAVAGGSASLLAQPVTVFRGSPEVKISEGGHFRNVQEIADADAVNLVCVISRIDDKYYWASRENVPMVAFERGAFVTYVAINGSGYVRAIRPELKSVAALLGDTEERFDYVEHMTHGLKTISYYGRIRR